MIKMVRFYNLGLPWGGFCVKMKSMENMANEQINEAARKRKIIIWGAVLVLVVLVVGTGAGAAYKYEEWKMARLAKKSEMGNKYLTQYLESKAKIKANKNDFDAYNKKGFAEAELGYFSAAENDYLKSENLNPANLFNLNDLVNLYLKKKNYPKAEEYYLKITSFDPKNSAAYRGLVTLYYDFYSEKKGEIEKILLKGIGELPEDQNLLGLLGAYYRTIAKDTQKTIEVYEKLLKLRPDDDLLKQEIDGLKKE
jgi:tetratricopeptide (TPR) repeat protein